MIDHHAPFVCSMRFLITDEVAAAQSLSPHSEHILTLLLRYRRFAIQPARFDFAEIEFQ